MKSTLTEELSRVKSLMGINESYFLRRRIPPHEVDATVTDALNYATQMWKKNRTVSLEQFARTVVTMIIDEFGPQLIDDRENFPYDEIFKFIAEKYYTTILDKFQTEFGPIPSE